MTQTVTEVELDVVLESRRTAADGVAVLRLRDPSGADLPPWEPGAHVDLLLGPELVRQYSLCGDPADRSVYQVAVLREPAGRGGSRYVHERLSERDTVRVRGPRNHFPLEPAPRYLFLAGGIGITPLLPMLAAAQRAGADWRLVYGGRSRESMAFTDALARYGNRVTVHPQDTGGLLDLASLLDSPRADTLVYCCGPESLLSAVEERCARWPAGALHVERFAPRESGAPARTGTFEVELARSGRVLGVPPDRSVLDVLEEAGAAILSSCREGTCGTCETGVLDGVPEHRDALLTDAERAANDTMFPCVSRSRGPRLVLDL